MTAFVFKIHFNEILELLSNEEMPYLKKEQYQPPVPLKVSILALYSERILIKSKHDELYSWLCGFLQCHLSHPVTLRLKEKGTHTVFLL
jgi:hypothetical protein